MGDMLQTWHARKHKYVCEAFHRLLKTVYLHQKQNRRIDYLLHILLKISKDKAYERLKKKRIKVNTHTVVQKINKRHKSAQRMVAASLVPVPKGEH